MKKEEPFRIGWLIPNSGIFPHLKKDLVQGLQTGLSPSFAAEIAFSYEYIGQGSTKETETGLRKLAQHEEVHLVIAVMSGKTILNVVPSLEKVRVPVLVLNL